MCTEPSLVLHPGFALLAARRGWFGGFAPRHLLPLLMLDLSTQQPRGALFRAHAKQPSRDFSLLCQRFHPGSVSRTGTAPSPPAGPMWGIKPAPTLGPAAHQATDSPSSGTNLYSIPPPSSGLGLPFEARPGGLRGRGGSAAALPPELLPGDRGSCRGRNTTDCTELHTRPESNKEKWTPKRTRDPPHASPQPGSPNPDMSDGWK